MRLLQRNHDGRFTVTEFTGDAIPHYAILSHTWGADHDEVTLTDLEKDTDMTKAGYKKLQFCADQASKDDLRYFWVDTCCIDKTSSAELTEAINSMFKWYRKATQCYAYLSDVSTGGISIRKAHPTRLVSCVPAKQMVHARLDAPRVNGTNIGRVLFGRRRATW
jgi:hypothetical protein